MDKTKVSAVQILLIELDRNDGSSQQLAESIANALTIVLVLFRRINIHESKDRLLTVAEQLICVTINDPGDSAGILSAHMEHYKKERNDKHIFHSILLCNETTCVCTYKSNTYVTIVQFISLYAK